MKELSKIKNYIYGKGIMSNFNNTSIIGIHKGKKFKISISNKKHINGKLKINLEIENKKYSPKDTREIIRLLN